MKTFCMITRRNGGSSNATCEECINPCASGVCTVTEQCASASPSLSPHTSFSTSPSASPSESTLQPSASTHNPSVSPSETPTKAPTFFTESPSEAPTQFVSDAPSHAPTFLPFHIKLTPGIPLPISNATRMPVLTITGVDFEQWIVCNISVGGKDVLDYNTTSTGLLFIPPDAPEDWGKTYQKLELKVLLNTEHPASDRVSEVQTISCPSDCLMRDRLYYSDVCPGGMFGSGKNCQKCPDGASCSAERVFPLSGFWRNPLEESSLEVVSCAYPAEERCPANLEDGFACGEGYSGYLCSECAPGTHYTGVGGTCLACAEENDSVAQYFQVLGVGLYFSVIVLAIATLTDDRLDSSVLALLGLQQFIVSVGSAEQWLPESLLPVYNIMKLTTFDYGKPRSVNAVFLRPNLTLQYYPTHSEFIRAECHSGKISFVQLCSLQVYVKVIITCS